MRLIYILLSSLVYLGCTTNAKTDVAEQIPPLEASIELPLFIPYEINVGDGNLKMYWQGSNGPFQTFQKLKEHLKIQGKELTFAMNGGMYLTDHSPQGLYIENGQTLRPLNTKKSDFGNFYLAPNGVFYITKDLAANVCVTEDFTPSENINYATQSGPMLLIDSTIHPKFTLGSKNVHIRNGVGILPNGNPLFVITTTPVNLYDFADYFRQQGCKNALYLDGFVSRLYLPEKGLKQMDGNFGVMIAEVK
ncbi:MAG TPA: hypothetical protein DCY51_09675 [Bacteroidetes bacterium]|nr:hypothetical protein [Bacteroidota bacterium]